MRQHDVITVHAEDIRIGDRIAIGGHTQRVESIGLLLRAEGRELALDSGARLALPPDTPVIITRLLPETGRPRTTR